MTSKRGNTQWAGSALALLALAVLVVLDLVIPPDYAILTSLFGLPPLIACSVVSPRGTAAIAALAFVAAVLSGVWNDTLATAQQNVRLLNVGLIGVVAVAIATVRVRREHRFAELSQIAQAAQRAILPALPSRVGHVRIAARYQSAAEGALVGGDLYDCYHSKDRVRLVVADVRGKGIAGVEQAARVIRAFRQAAALRPTLVEVACEMDEYLAGFFGEEEFVTALLVDVTEPNELRMVSAGHPGPQLAGQAGAVLLDLPPGLPLGLGLGSQFSGYAEAIVPWRNGDRLLLYTDGLSEARDRSGEFLPVASLAPRMRAGSVEQAVDEIVAAAAAHVPGGKLDDDLAVVLIQNLTEDHEPSGVEAHEAGGEWSARAVAACVVATGERDTSGPPAGGTSPSGGKVVGTGRPRVTGPHQRQRLGGASALCFALDVALSSRAGPSAPISPAACPAGPDAF